jgi:hypothetical protein
MDAWVEPRLNGGVRIGCGRQRMAFSPTEAACLADVIGKLNRPKRNRGYIVGTSAKKHAQLMRYPMTPKPGVES